MSCRAAWKGAPRCRDAVVGSVFKDFGFDRRIIRRQQLGAICRSGCATDLGIGVGIVGRPDAAAKLRPRSALNLDQAVDDGLARYGRADFHSGRCAPDRAVQGVADSGKFH